MSPRPKSRPWQDEFDTATRLLAEHGGAVTWSQHDHEAFRYLSDDALLIFYPHCTTAGHRHIRVRSQHSRDPRKAAALMQMLNGAEMHRCTFSFKKLPA